jgi:glycosyltransferase involved in cell wall biosynthesis
VIGYLIGNFPKASETFVYREVLNLQGEGLKVKTFSFGHDFGSTARPDKTIQQLIKDTAYLNKWASLITLIIHPILTLKIIQKTIELQMAATNRPSLLLLLARSVHLATYLKRANIKKLHTHWPYASMVGYLASLIYECTLSISIHAHEAIHENGHFNVILPNCKFISFCNNAAKNITKKNFDIDEKKINLNYHGVDINKFTYCNTPVIKGSINVISSGRLTKTKGFDRLITVCAKARSEGIPVNLTILGEGGARNELISVASENKYLDYFSLPGWIENNKVSELLHQSHLFALLCDTNYHDGLPNVVLEAMSCGRSAIVSPFPAADEIIDNGKGGWILPQNNYEKIFTDIIIECFTNPTTLKIKGKEAREIIIQKYSDQIHIKKLAQLLLEI